MNRGFTLIEMLIAIALSMAVILTAVAGVRMGAQSIAVANRLATENSLMRAGYMMAVHEADYWQSYDQPEAASASGQPLRSFEAGRPSGRGLPFTPFATSGMTRAGTAGTEDERGWDDVYQWPASDSRTWFHGNLVEQVDRTQHRFGHYELFCHAKRQPKLDKMFANGVAYAAAGAVLARHTWLCNQLEGLKNTMGYYGVCEYMPANAIYGVVGEPGNDNAFGDWSAPDGSESDDDDQSLEREWCQPAGSGGGVDWRFANDDGGTAWPRGIYRIVRDSSFAIIPSSPLTDVDTSTWSLDTLVRNHVRSWATDRVGDASYTGPGGHGIVDLLAKARMAIPTLRLKPTTWPAVTYEVMRYLNNSRFVCLNKIRWVSPITGDTAEFSFTCVATSLRGARQQRAPSGGWARVGQPNLDAP